VRRHEAIANNIANVNTPGYRRRDVPFQTTLARALETSQAVGLVVTRPGHQLPAADQVAFRAQLATESTMRNDGSTVDIEQEMVELSGNALYYSAVSRQLQAGLARLRAAITEGRR
jgi:flagellar basal-body rod protein FlgB